MQSDSPVAGAAQLVAGTARAFTHPNIDSSKPGHNVYRSSVIDNAPLTELLATGAKF